NLAIYLIIAILVLAVIVGLTVGLAGISSGVQGMVIVPFALLGVVIGFAMPTSKTIEKGIFYAVMVALAILVASTLKVFQILNATIFGLGYAIDMATTYTATFLAAVIIILAIRAITPSKAPTSKTPKGKRKRLWPSFSRSRPKRQQPKIRKGRRRRRG
ncbi:MAG: hypothetical protein ABH852_03300, partial [Methanobacteriota archaeon]